MNGSIFGNDIVCSSDYKPVKRLKKNADVWLVEINEHFFVRKVVTSNVLWERLESFNETYPKKRALLERISGFYRIMSTLGYGPEVITDIYDNELVILMEYLPKVATSEIIEERKDEISKLVNSLHKEGYVHGDLISDNIRLDENDKFRLIDFETMFTIDEVKTNPVISEYLSEFDMGLDEFLAYESEENYLDTYI